MFIDASALCAVLLDEPDRASMERMIAGADNPLTSPVAAWETARAVMRDQGVSARQAMEDVDGVLSAAGVRMMPVVADHYRLALDAFERFGKGRHPAALNMGDCFAYACATAADQPLLYKGDDFARTDIEPA
jgi:ribonuclease VapC